jgi:hypothetical protein
LGCEAPVTTGPLGVRPSVVCCVGVVVGCAGVGCAGVVATCNTQVPWLEQEAGQDDNSQAKPMCKGSQ